MNITDRILYLLLRVMRKVIELAPSGPVYKSLRLLGLLAYLFMGRRREITVENIKRAFPERDAGWCRMTARSVFMNFGRNMAEFIKFAGGRMDGMVKVDGMEKIEGGVVLMTGHMGNWEITGMSITALGKELYPVGRRIHSRAFDRIVDDIRTSFGSHHIPYRGSIREILRKIKHKKNICVLIDQRMTSGLPVHFFGRPVWATHIVSVLRRRTGVKVIPAYSYHDKGRVQVVYEPPMELDQGKGDSLKADFINTSKQMNWLEERIKEHPDEWFWMHNFWKDRWPCAFLDRDGTINVEHGYVHREEQLEFIPGALEAMRELRKAGYLIVIVTNQSGIARGYYTEKDFLKFNGYFMERLKEEGVIADGVYYCPHHPDSGCGCRKPSGWMVRRAAKELNIDIPKSIVIGDKTSDIEMGNRLGMKTILVLTGHGREHADKAAPDLTVRDIGEAVRELVK